METPTQSEAPAVAGGSGSGSGWGKTVIGIVIVLVIVGGVILWQRSGGSPETKEMVQSGSVQPSPSSLAGTKLSDSPFASHAYLISTDTLSADAKTALSGFSVAKVANADGTVTYNLTSTNPEYQNQSYTLQKGQQLYFIEMSLGDDSGDGDRNIRDDHALVVDADGVIVSQ